ncbi:MAG TPA: trypco2 family protein [Ktedonobacteraceae bacterium]
MSIGLAELIQQVEAELLSYGPGTGKAPLFYVKEVTLELQVTIGKEGNAGLRIQVIEAGGAIKREDVHTITITLDPIIEKQVLVDYYNQHAPGGAQLLPQMGVRGILKGDKQESQEDTFNTPSDDSE